MKKQRIKLTIEYDGADYAGWQIQPNAKTVQGELEKALETVFNQSIRIIGSGRTDSGVHARAQVAHCDVPDSADLYRLKASLNGLSGPGVTVKAVESAADDFSSRYDATGRRYCYYISETPVSIHREQCWIIYRELDLDYLNELSQSIIGDKDFESFTKKHSSVEHYRSVVDYAKWYRQGSYVVFEIKAIRFLRGMVRSLVGTLLDFEKNKKKQEEFAYILAGKSRALAGENVPAHGLFLEEIYYD